MQDDFSNLRLDDSCITKLIIAGNEVRVFIRNWREESEGLVFVDVIGIEAFSFINAELSHGTVTNGDPLLEKSCLVGGERTAEFRCYAFFSTWSECPILKIIARSISIDKA